MLDRTCAQLAAVITANGQSAAGGFGYRRVELFDNGSIDRVERWSEVGKAQLIRISGSRYQTGRNRGRSQDIFLKNHLVSSQVDVCCRFCLSSEAPCSGALLTVLHRFATPAVGVVFSRFARIRRGRYPHPDIRLPVLLGRSLLCIVRLAPAQCKDIANRNTVIYHAK